jgi:prepilin-type N-terminal cleavage/methylation domain-containing protein
MDNDQGFSLIELIVVMLILSTLAVGSVTGFHLLNSGSAKNAAMRINASLDLIQIENMTKNNSFTLKIYKADSSDNYQMVIVTTNSLGIDSLGTPETIELRDGQIEFEYNNSGTWNMAGLGDPSNPGDPNVMTVGFRKDTGGVKADSMGNTVTRIKITSRGTDCYIRLVTVTGKHFIE